MNYTWRRFRTCVKQCQDPAMYEYLVSQPCLYMLLEEHGKVDIYYGDESGFSLEPNIPYGWQPPGEYTRITPATSQRLNVLGLMSRNNDLHAWSVEGTINADVVIACLDEFAAGIKTKTVVVLDNATIHHSEKFNAKLAEWLRKGLRIFHLPAYSPHLNIIETLWRMIKYKWLKPGDYQNMQTLKHAIDRILNSVGDTLKIDFGESKHFAEYKAAFI